MKLNLTDPERARAERRAIEMQWWSQDRVEAHQLERLGALLDHAYSSTSYYRSMFDSVGAHPRDIQTLDDFAQLPVLEKSVIASQLESLVSTEDRSRHVVEQSTGSTGTPLKIVRRPGGVETATLAALMHAVCDTKVGQRSLQLWGRDIGGSTCHVDRLREHAYFSFQHMTADGFNELLDFIAEWRPQIVTGYVTVLHEVALALADRRIGDLQTRLVQTHAERLFPHQRQAIEQGFGGPVYDFYGSTEISYLGSECIDHSGMHLFTPYRIFEVDGPDPAAGELLVTDLANLAMPLIRYRIGDVIRLNSTTCACGRSLPRAYVDGRTIDLFRLANGDVMYTVFFDKLIDSLQVKRYLVHQRSYDRVDLYIVPTDAYRDEYGQTVVRAIQDRTNAQVRLQVVADIDDKIAGKTRMVRSDVVARRQPRA